jgi:hypothetical protein
MRRLFATVAALALALALPAGASAAPNITNVNQKGSLLIFPDIDVRGTTTTIVRIANDGGSAIDVKCVWIDGNKNRADFIVTLTRDQVIWIDAATGEGTTHVNRFPASRSNGFDNPFLTVGNESNDGSEPYRAGLLACFAINEGAEGQVKWNHLVGRAIVLDPEQGWAYEYTAYAFFVQGGLERDPVGTPGRLELNGVEYDACPLYLTGQFSPADTPLPDQTEVVFNRLALAGCTLNLNQDWTPVYTKLQFDVWNGDEIKFTGAYECADSWHELAFGDVDAASGNFLLSNLGTLAARYRVQGVKSTECETSRIKTQAVGLVGVQVTGLLGEGPMLAGTTLHGSGKFAGRVVWDPKGALPDAGVR